MPHWAGYAAAGILLLGGTAAWMTAPELSERSPIPSEIKPVRSAAAAVPPTQGAGEDGLPGGMIAESERSAAENRQRRLSPQEREVQRFRRQDRDKDGQISETEFVASRRKAFGRLDKDRDGRLSFEEYAASTFGRFAKADRDKDGRLNPAEFAKTRARTQNRDRERNEAATQPRRDA